MAQRREAANTRASVLWQRSQLEQQAPAEGPPAAQATPTAVGDATAVTQAAPEPSTKARRNADVFFETETIIRHLLEPKPVKR